jgi:15-cis-phytoene synthase
MSPSTRERVFALPADRAACRASIRQGSRSFHLASLLLPISVREPAYAVYALCRMADDLIDGAEAGRDGIARIDALLDRAYAGRPAADPIERSFADIVAEFAIPRAVPQALVEGLAWDVEGRRYETLDDLLAYGVRVAGTVGLMMSLVMQRQCPKVLARACDLGVAMQITNICRDIGEDAANGRIYLPLEMMAAHGLDADAFLASPAHCTRLRALTSELLEEAERLYARSLSGIAMLPAGCRPGIGAARLFYREIGRTVLGGADPVVSRVVVSGPRKAALLPLLVSERTEPSLGQPVLPQARFLIDAIAAMPVRRHRRLPPWWRVGARAERMVELLASLPESGKT